VSLRRFRIPASSPDPRGGGLVSLGRAVSTRFARAYVLPARGVYTAPAEA